MFDNYQIYIEPNKEVLKTIKETRQNRLLTQGDVANAIGVLKGSYGKYERGNSKIPYESFLRICKMLGIDNREAIRTVLDKINAADYETIANNHAIGDTI